jgi:hypothetical protein
MPTLRIDSLPRVAPTPKHPVSVNVRTLPANGHVASHAHGWAQLACTMRGAMRLRAGQTTWIVPPTRAVWIPPRVEHEVSLIGEVELRTVYVDASAAPRGLATCDVIDVSALMRELIEGLANVDWKVNALRYEPLARLLLEEMRDAPTLSLDLRPTDGACAPCARRWKTGASFDWRSGRQRSARARTLARLFQQELG